MKRINIEAIKAIFFLVFFTALAAWLMSIGMAIKNFYLILLGIIFIIIEIRIEYSYLQKTNIQVKKLDKELKNSIEQAQMTIEAMKKILEQLERLMSKSQMENVMSNINLTIKDQHSKILSEMKDLQSLIYKDVESHCQQKFGQLAKKVQELEVKISK